MAEDDEMINMKKADEDIDQIDAPESSNVEEESTRLKKQKIKEKILEKVKLKICRMNKASTIPPPDSTVLPKIH